MPLMYSIQPKKNRQRPEDPEKFYIVSSAMAQVDFESLIDEASEETTLNKDELRLGLNLLFKKAVERLFEGNTVKFPNIGHIGLRVHSSGSDTPDEVSVAGNVKDIKPYFVFSADIREKLKKTKLKKKEA